jgi:hypothetical protein
MSAQTKFPRNGRKPSSLGMDANQVPKSANGSIIASTWLGAGRKTRDMGSNLFLNPMTDSTTLEPGGNTAFSRRGHGPH